MRMLTCHLMGAENEALHAASSELHHTAIYADALALSAVERQNAMSPIAWAKKIDDARGRNDQTAIEKLTTAHKRTRLLHLLMAKAVEETIEQLAQAQSNSRDAIRAALNAESQSHPCSANGMTFHTMLSHNAAVLHGQIEGAKSMTQRLREAHTKLRLTRQEVVECQPVAIEALEALKALSHCIEYHNGLTTLDEPSPVGATHRSDTDLVRILFSLVKPAPGSCAETLCAHLKSLSDVFEPCSKELSRFKERKGFVNEQQYAQRVVASLYDGHSNAQHAAITQQSEAAEQQKRRLSYECDRFALSTAASQVRAAQDAVHNALRPAIDEAIEAITTLKSAEAHGRPSPSAFTGLLICMYAERALREANDWFKVFDHEQKTDITEGRGREAWHALLEEVRGIYAPKPVKK